MGKGPHIFTPTADEMHKLAGEIMNLSKQLYSEMDTELGRERWTKEQREAISERTEELLERLVRLRRFNNNKLLDAYRQTIYDRDVEITRLEGELEESKKKQLFQLPEMKPADQGS